MLASSGTPIVRPMAGFEKPVWRSAIAPERSRIAHTIPTGSGRRSNAVRNALAPSPNNASSRGSAGLTSPRSLARPRGARVSSRYASRLQGCRRRRNRVPARTSCAHTCTDPADRRSIDELLGAGGKLGHGCRASQTRPARGAMSCACRSSRIAIAREAPPGPLLVVHCDSGGAHRLLESGIALAECERVRLGAGLEQRDLQRSVADRVVLAHQLVHAAVPKHAVPVRIDVEAVCRAWRLAVEAHAEGHRGVPSGRKYDVCVARMEPEGDAAARLVEDDVLGRDRPLSGGRPMVEGQVLWERVD